MFGFRKSGSITPLCTFVPFVVKSSEGLLHPNLLSGLMQRLPIDSRAIRSAAYDPELLILEIEFINGSIYHYYRVPSATYQQFCEADSKGIFVNQSIKPNFEYREIRKPAR